MSLRSIVKFTLIFAAAFVLSYYAAYWVMLDKHPGFVEERGVSLRLVNVLDKEQFDDAHIDGGAQVQSIQSSLQDLPNQAAEWDKSVPVVTYCSNYYCLASSSAAEKLMDLGFKEVYAYEAGMAEWFQLSQQDKEYRVAGPAQAKYLNIKVKKSSKKHENIRLISSQQLKELIKKANLKKEE